MHQVFVDSETRQLVPKFGPKQFFVHSNQYCGVYQISLSNRKEKESISIIEGKCPVILKLMTRPDIPPPSHHSSNWSVLLASWLVCWLSQPLQGGLCRLQHSLAATMP